MINQPSMAAIIDSNLRSSKAIKHNPLQNETFPSSRFEVETQPGLNYMLIDSHQVRSLIVAAQSKGFQKTEPLKT